MKIFAVGDVVGTNGLEFLRSHLSNFKRENNIDLCIVNGENASDGNGITPSAAEHIFASGADVITTGNHAYRRREMYDYFDNNEFVIRPLNYSNNNPGRGYCKVDKGRLNVGVINLMGTMYMEALDNPFNKMSEVLDELSDCRIIIVDFHAEATSEKRAMGFFLNGKVSAVFGTHTHVQTSDEQILKDGTGYITDVGMTGPLQSVLGVKPEIVVEKFKYNMPARFDYADGESILGGCIFDIDDKTGKTVGVQRVLLK